MHQALPPPAPRNRPASSPAVAPAAAAGAGCAAGEGSVRRGGRRVGRRVEEAERRELRHGLLEHEGEALEQLRVPLDRHLDCEHARHAHHPAHLARARGRAARAQHEGGELELGGAAGLAGGHVEERRHAGHRRRRVWQRPQRRELAREQELLVTARGAGSGCGLRRWPSQAEGEAADALAEEQHRGEHATQPRDRLAVHPLDGVGRGLEWHDEGRARLATPSALVGDELLILPAATVRAQG